MAEAGLGGAYLMPIFGPDESMPFQPQVAQLTPEFWAMVDHALGEAERLGLEISMHACDGFAVAGGPWIQPEESMQKIVWSEGIVSGSGPHALAEPPSKEGYYRDVAVFAYPRRPGEGVNSIAARPTVTTSVPGEAPQYLADPSVEGVFRSEEPCWIQYRFVEPFTARSLLVTPQTNNYQSNRLRVLASDDGATFREIARLESPRHGWQDRDANFTHELPPTTARYFRFEFGLEGTEAGAEDLDRAKWRPSLKLVGLELLGASRLHQYEGKSGLVWRVARESAAELYDTGQVVRREDLLDLSVLLEADGTLRWEAPPGEWSVLRFGHTSTGHTNATGGAAKGLEADKFNAVVVRKQYEHWFGEAMKVAGPRAPKVLSGFHVDSWECGSQNWSPVFQDAFRLRRGYDITPYLPLFAGVPIDSIQESERVLRDLRTTIGELVDEVFFGTLAEVTQAAGLRFSAESVAPTMTSDGMRHFDKIDLPMGEFWLRSPTHDKPNDILDAVSGARVYGKRIVQAEAYTELRMEWDEHPGMLKSLGDRNYALGINRFVYHVFTHNPFMDRTPGVTLNGVGLYFQRDQTWWKPGKAWGAYANRSQALLQRGVPVVDLAVYTGDEMPRRSLLPDRLVASLPGLFGPERVAAERERLRNEGQPERLLPVGVRHSANMADPEDWVDPLRGYAYDSINQDALLRLATVEDGTLVLPGGARYAVLVVPAVHPLAPGGSVLVDQTRAALERLAKDGARIIRADEEAYAEADLRVFGVEPDLLAIDAAGRRVEGLAWTHRREGNVDIYFVANPTEAVWEFELSLRESGREPEIWDAVDGSVRVARAWRVTEGRTELPLRLEANQSLFVVLRKAASPVAGYSGTNERKLKPLDIDPGGPWTLRFGEEDLVVEAEGLRSWSESEDARIRHFSGTAIYEKSFDWQEGKAGSVWLDLGKVANLASVALNGVDCGVAWTPPYRVRIDGALRAGENRLRIEVSNTLANRIIGELEKPEAERDVWTSAPLEAMRGRVLLEGGLLGPVGLYAEEGVE